MKHYHTSVASLTPYVLHNHYRKHAKSFSQERESNILDSIYSLLLDIIGTQSFNWPMCQNFQNQLL